MVCLLHTPRTTLPPSAQPRITYRSRVAISLIAGLVTGGSLMAGTAVADGSAKAPDIAQPRDPVTVLFEDGRIWLDARYRFEHVEQEGLANDANANTLRTRAGFETGALHGISGVFEVENVTHLGADDFNDTLNGRTTYPVVADPEDTQINQAFIRVTGQIPGTEVKLGRQVISLANQRFIGPVGFRQNIQTFDAFGFVNRTLKNTSVQYNYISQVNRIFGDKSSAGVFESNSHSVQVDWQASKRVAVSGYAHLLDLQNADALSSQTYGARITGNLPLPGGVTLTLAGEVANQRDYADNPANFDLTYRSLQGGLAYRGFSIKVAREVLPGDGVNAFQTPLATLHAFQGAADKFLTTPSDGIEDDFVSASYTTKALAFGKSATISAAYHDFDPENAGPGYGTELDLAAVFAYDNRISARIDYANYDAKSFGADTQKFWFAVQVRY